MSPLIICDRQERGATMQAKTVTSVEGQSRALWMSTIAFTVCFAVWTIFAIIGIQIKQELGLNETQFGLLVGTPILTGSLVRIFLGIWTDQYGGRRVYTAVMLAAAVATFLLIYAHTYSRFLIAALGVGIAGGSFAVGIAYVSRWYSAEKQGTALGIFGAGNVGAAVTKFCAPFVLVAYGWQMTAQVWAAAIAVMAIVFWFTTRKTRSNWRAAPSGEQPRSAWLELEPLKNVQVWRFALYYFFVFGAFVALSLWLPRYLIGVYRLDIETAGMLGAAYSIPASLFRTYGGVLSDRYGARRIMYWMFGVSALITFILAYPPTEYVVQGIARPDPLHMATGVVTFTCLIFVLGFFMSLGKAAVYKHIPVYYPDNVGSVGGLVGMIGGLGGFVLPIAFGALNDLTGIWTSCFMLLFLIAAGSLVWMHFAIQRMEREALAHRAAQAARIPGNGADPRGRSMLARSPGTCWRNGSPRTRSSGTTRAAPSPGAICGSRFPHCCSPSRSGWCGRWWSPNCRRSASSSPLTSCSGWRPCPGCRARRCASSIRSCRRSSAGGCGRRISTWSLMIPAVGIGLAVQSPDTPYIIFLSLALLCGFGGGNFASSMANISFFFPKAEKGNALALNAGLGNLGVSVVQFVIPLVITTGVFGWFGGDPQVAASGASKLWLQNAGFIWVPFIAISAFAAWFGMHDIADMRASFADQAVIFKRKHNWLMCWLYTGTFGSFIGYSAGFPLLAKIEFPHVDSLKFIFLGPLVGALSRSATGWLSDRYGGGRVTFWVFALMIAAVAGVLYFLGIKDQPEAFWGFFAMFMILFFATGVGNASTFQMIPAIMRVEISAARAGHEPGAAAAAGRNGIGGDHRLHLGGRGLWRLFHPESLRLVDLADRRTGVGAVGLHGVLRDLRGHHLELLHPPRRPAARHRTRAPAAARCRATGRIKETGR